ncbi:hypothetical protein Nepgr_017071 [Nepenthes gracilis]|uniref:Uncharacterized protein n=1 Tax=Nepenthes gracilis TaxID=150966 RepID=A0AAD3SNS1_NEPGR|nr:hypothetical protein Nepgr_017071 [Nepenthes gracilis]
MQRQVERVAPVNRLVALAELGEWLLTVTGAAMAVLLGLGQNNGIQEEYMPFLIVLLALGFLTLFTASLFQDCSPEYVTVVAVIGAICVAAAFFVTVEIRLLLNSIHFSGYLRLCLSPSSPLFYTPFSTMDYG